MKLLLDECLPRRLKLDFQQHQTLTVEDAGLKGLKNGPLLRAAAKQFEVLVTVDLNIVFQQNLADIDLALIILRSEQLCCIEVTRSGDLGCIENNQTRRHCYSSCRTSRSVERQLNCPSFCDSEFRVQMRIARSVASGPTQSQTTSTRTLADDCPRHHSPRHDLSQLALRCAIRRLGHSRYRHLFLDHVDRLRQSVSDAAGASVHCSKRDSCSWFLHRSIDLVVGGSSVR